MIDHEGPPSVSKEVCPPQPTPVLRDGGPPIQGSASKVHCLGQGQMRHVLWHVKVPFNKQPEMPDSLDDIASEEEIHSDNAWESGIGCVHVGRDGRHKECQNCRRATCETESEFSMWLWRILSYQFLQCWSPDRPAKRERRSPAARAC